MKSKNFKGVRALLTIFVLSITLLSSFVVYANFDENDYELAIEEKRYKDALNIISNKEESKRTVIEIEMLDSLQVVIDVTESEWPKNSIALKEDEVDPDILKKVKKYESAAIKSYLAGKKSIGRHVLLQILYLYPDHPRTVLFLTKGYLLPPGSYSVKDQVSKLVSRSDNYFYGGNYLKAAEDLEVLAILEKQNAVIYEKLGSTYYMMNQKQKAIDAWTTALFFNPNKQELEGMIENTKEMIAKEAEKGSPLSQAEQEKVVIDDPQVMGVFKRQSEAFELTKKLREQGLTVAIEENEGGKWVVQVSRKELQQQNAGKGNQE